MKEATLRELLKDVPGARVVGGGAERDDDIGVIGSMQEPTAEEAELVEGTEFAAFDIEVPSETEFTHFLDGVERRWRAAYVGFAPIMLAHTSAGIVERREREVLPPEPYLGELEAFIPNTVEIADRFAGRLPVQVVDVGPEPTSVGMQEAITNQISERRSFRELSLANGFRTGKLLVDGGIGKMVAKRKEDEQPFIVGFVKSHRKQYFKTPGRVATILSMKAGQRTSVFMRKSAHPSEENVYSFYLKLHEAEDESPTFGLARIEMPARDEYLAQTDAIAGWILKERAPLSLPDRRFDRLLYPIRLVEKHLKARQPSDAAIRGIVG